MMSTGYDDHDLPPMRPEGGHSLALAGEYAAIGILTALCSATRRARPAHRRIDPRSSELHDRGRLPQLGVQPAILQRQTDRHAAVTRRHPGTALLRRPLRALMGGGFPRDARVWYALLAWMDETDRRARSRAASSPAAPRPRSARSWCRTSTVSWSRSRRRCYRRGQACHLPWGLIRNPEENLDDPHWPDRGYFVKVSCRASTAGAHPRPALQILPNAGRRPPPRAPPRRAQLRGLQSARL